MPLEDILRRISAENQTARAKFENLSHRTVSAVVNNDRDAFSEIIRDAGNDGDDSGKSEASGTGTVEVGDAHRDDRDTLVAEAQTDE
jgi:hypothetical protein